MVVLLIFCLCVLGAVATLDFTPPPADTSKTGVKATIQLFLLAHSLSDPPLLIKVLLSESGLEAGSVGEQAQKPNSWRLGEHTVA